MGTFTIFLCGLLATTVAVIPTIFFIIGINKTKPVNTDIGRIREIKELELLSRVINDK